MTHQKPFRGIQLNRTHPLVKGLVGCWIFNEATGETVFDLSGHNNHGALKNGVTWDGNGLDLDGINDYVDYGDKEIFDGVEGLSLVFWGKAKDLTSGAGYDRIISKRKTAGAAPGWLLQGNSTAGTIIFQAYINGVNEQAISSTILNPSIWYCVVCTWDKADLKIYINGVLEDTKATGATMSTTTEALRIGTSELQATTFFCGSVASTYLYNRALLADEATWLYKEPYAIFRRLAID